MNKSKQNTNLNIEECRARVLEKHEYTLIKKLWQGVSGTAFLVQSKEGGTYVMTEISYSDVEDRDKIKDEIEILTSLKNPYFVDYDESFEDEEARLLYTVMENCTGEDLYTVMKAQGKNGVFEEQQILDWFVQICLALQDLHKKGVLHRDIKPQNVFLTEEGYIILCRFGCLKAMEGADESAESVVGTDLYVSPEVFSHSYDFKSDIWSLGWLLHDLCMLNVWSHIIERRCAHAFSMKGNPPPIEERYSEELRELIKEMLCRDPKDRPSTDEILAKPFLKDAVDRRSTIPKALIERFMKDTKIFENTYGDLKAFLSEWEKTTDLLEEVHRKCTIASLSGSVIGVAGGITSLVGAILIPFTFGVSIIVSAVGASVGIAGAVTSAASNIANAVQQESLHESLKSIVQKYENISEPILNSSNTLMLLRKIQTFRIFLMEKMTSEEKFDKIQVSRWVARSTVTLLYATQLMYLCLLENLSRAGAEAGVEAGVQAGVEAGVQAGAQAGVQAGAEAGVEAGVQAGVKAGAQAGVQAVAQAVAQAGAQAGVQAVAQAGAQAGVQAGVEAGAQAGVQAGAEAGVEAGAQAGAEAGVQAGVKAGAQAVAQAGVQAVAQAGVQAGVEAGAQAGVQAGAEAGVQAGAEAGVQAGAQAGAEAGVEAGVQAGAEAGVEAGVQAGAQAGIQAGAQATRVGRAAAAAAEAVLAVAAVSGVLSGLLIIADAVFIGIDSREIHQMRQGKIDDPEKVSSRVLKGIAQMRKMHKGLDNILESIIETREYIKQNCMSHTE